MILPELQDNHCKPARQIGSLSQVVYSQLRVRPNDYTLPSTVCSTGAIYCAPDNLKAHLICETNQKAWNRVKLDRTTGNVEWNQVGIEASPIGRVRDVRPANESFGSIAIFIINVNIAFWALRSSPGYCYPGRVLSMRTAKGRTRVVIMRVLLRYFFGGLFTRNCCIP